MPLPTSRVDETATRKRGQVCRAMDWHAARCRGATERRGHGRQLMDGAGPVRPLSALIGSDSTGREGVQQRARRRETSHIQAEHVVVVSPAARLRGGLSTIQALDAARQGYVVSMYTVEVYGSAHVYSGAQRRKRECTGGRGFCPV